MGTVLPFRETTRPRRKAAGATAGGVIVIFPGVRIERGIDLGRRVRAPGWQGQGGRGGPRKSS